MALVVILLVVARGLKSGGWSRFVGPNWTGLFREVSYLLLQAGGRAPLAWNNPRAALLFVLHLVFQQLCLHAPSPESIGTYACL